MNLSRTAALLSALFFGACAPRKIVPQAELFAQPGIRIGVGTVKEPPPQALKAGAQGLLDLAINAAMDSKLRKRLGDIDLTGFHVQADTFSKELNSRGYSARTISAPIDLSQFDKAPKASGYFEKDMREFGRIQQLDYLVLLSVDAWGTIREYYGFIPLGSPSGYFQVTGRMIDLRTGQLVWQAQLDHKKAAVPSTGAWDNPPDYPELLSAIDRAIGLGKNFLFADFFTSVPVSKSVPAEQLLR